MSDFSVEILLTEKGLANYEAVLAVIFKYSQRLLEVGPQQFIFDEIMQIGQINFDFADKSNAQDNCVFLTEKMQNFKDDEEGMS